MIPERQIRVYAIRAGLGIFNGLVRRGVAYMMRWAKRRDNTIAERAAHLKRTGMRHPDNGPPY